MIRSFAVRSFRTWSTLSAIWTFNKRPIIVSWIGTDLTSQKANLLIELINSDNGAVDDSEDALLEELAVYEDLDGLKIDDSFRNKFPDYFE